jgi:methionyl-tRNA formyltransferase
MKLCIFGNKVATKELVIELVNAGVNISCVVTLDAHAAKNITISGKDDSLIDFASSQEIHVFNPESYSLKSQKDISFFQTENFDLGLCTGWQRLIPKDVIDSFSHGIFGWHGSGFEFPNGRGRSPLNWTLRLGLKKVFHNCFKYSSGVDDGSVYDTVVIPIEQKDYIIDLQRKAFQHIKRSSLRLITELNDGPIVLTPQPIHPHISLPALDESSGEIFPILMSREQTINIIRSCSKPFPGAFVRHNGAKFRVWSAKVDSSYIQTDQNVLIVEDKLVISLKDGQIASDDFEVLRE